MFIVYIFIFVLLVLVSFLAYWISELQRSLGNLTKMHNRNMRAIAEHIKHATVEEIEL